MAYRIGSHPGKNMYVYVFIKRCIHFFVVEKDAGSLT